MKLINMTLEEIYLDWVNNFISTDAFCEHYNITKEQAVQLLYFIEFLGYEE